MQRILIVNANIWDAIVDGAYPGSVLIEGNRIKTVAKNAPLDAAGAEVIDGAGMTLMPGLVEGHCHPVSPASPIRRNLVCCRRKSTCC